METPLNPIWRRDGCFQIRRSWVYARCVYVCDGGGWWMETGSMVGGRWMYTMDVDLIMDDLGFFLVGWFEKQTIQRSQSINVKGARAHRTLND
jgi:phenolic acid decarboxylase